MAACVLIFGLSAAAGRGQSLPFATYSSDDGLAESVVLALWQDRSGYLWLGTPSGVSRFDGLVFTNYDTTHGLPGTVARAFLEDRRGELWVAGKGVYRFDGASFERVH